ncbi:hypothetical protein OIU77_016757 [Salix suchowensis]|uniref:HTH myb-type domain-containing protein n=1 Tax=Salix suchowensis TaxID=1278906 RepID=A0ABQ8ZLG0_9ROSI|nr:hypothetical protein OIU77_016757 [Salix suchowensis]
MKLGSDQKNDGLMMDASGKRKDEEGDGESKTKTSASSSNSIVDESEKASSSGVRPYVRSKVPRLRWTPDLHLRFAQAVERLGGYEMATPKLVLQQMNTKGLSIAHVKSHLQMYRSKKIDDQGQVINSRGGLIGSSDYFSLNFWQHSLLPNFDHSLSSNFRSRSVSRSTGHGNWIASPSVLVPDSMTIRSGAGFYNSISERINVENGSSTRHGPFHTCKNPTFNDDHRRKLKQEFLDTESHRSMCSGNSIRGQVSSTTKQPYFAAQISKRGGDTNESISSETKWSFNAEKCSQTKRKADDLDLSLTLFTESKEKEARRSFIMGRGRRGKQFISFPIFYFNKRKQFYISESMPSKHPKLTSTLDLTM